MKVEIRNNSVHIEGYVNVPLRDSRPLIDTRGKFVEQIMPKAFQDSLHKRSNVDLLFNHREDRKLGSTVEGNLTLSEDVIGLRAQCMVTDPEVVEKAKRGELRGWSFGFYATEQRWEPVNDGLQRRFVDGLELLEVSILDCTPAYLATTIEARGEDAVLLERRFDEFEIKTEIVEQNDEPEERAADDHSLGLFELDIEILKLKGR